MTLKIIHHSHVQAAILVACPLAVLVAVVSGSGVAIGHALVRWEDRKWHTGNHRGQE